MRSDRFRLLLIFLLAFSMMSELYPQCSNHVSHLSGTQVVNGISVTVTSSGQVASLLTYCANTTPYFIGYNYTTGSGTGEYVFNFSPAVSSLTLNFGGTSNVSTAAEEVRLFVNGAHYAIPAAGVSNSCDAMAVLTPAGDMGGCSNCSVSGWSGTTVPGPINTIRVQNFELFGAANGSLFSMFLCDPVVLPVDLIKFKALLVNKYEVKLNWTTSSENNNAFFSVERSQDGQQWEEVLQVPGAGDSDMELNYSAFDRHVLSGITQYRLKQTDFDGAIAYSEISIVDFGAETAVQVYPVPAQKFVNLSFSGIEETQVEILNALGQLVHAPATVINGSMKFNLSGLKTGIYFFRMQRGTKLEMHKFSVE